MPYKEYNIRYDEATNKIIAILGWCDVEEDAGGLPYIYEQISELTDKLKPEICGEDD